MYLFYCFESLKEDLSIYISYRYVFIYGCLPALCKYQMVTLGRL